MARTPVPLATTGPVLLALLAPTAAAQSLDHFVAGEHAAIQLGWAIAGVGDLDADGYDDFAVGVPFGPAFTGNAGNVELRSGRTGERLGRLFGDQPGERFGYSIVSAGDWDGDDAVDLLVGSPAWDSPTVEGVGRVRVMSTATGAALATFEGDTVTSGFGVTADVLSDLDGDGVPEVIVGTPTLGRVMVFSGRTSAVRADHSIHFGMCGSGVTAAGDVDGDGIEDYAYGSPVANGPQPIQAQAGAVTVHSGATGAVLWVRYGEPSERMGHSIDGISDLDGDGVRDLVVGSLNWVSIGRVKVLSGADGSTIHEIPADLETFSNGMSVAAGGDIDGDGVEDFISGGPLASIALDTRRGRVAAYSGATGERMFLIEGDPGPYSFGTSVAIVGDVDADGFDEIGVGNPFDSTGVGPIAGSASVHSRIPENGEAVCLGAVNGSGSRVRLAATGSFLSAQNALVLRTSAFPPGTNAMMLVSPGFGVVLSPGGAAGSMCLDGGPIGRYRNALFAATNAAPAWTFAPNLVTIPSGSALVAVQPGETWLWQAWYRDVGSGGTAFTDAVAVSFD